jgi:RNA polymerase sigma-70 factor (sigma-E family)
MATMERTPALIAPPRARDLQMSHGLGFEEFFEQHHVGLFRALWLVTRNRHEAEEIMQDAFLKMWERWDEVSSMAEPAGYLYRTAMNLLRSRGRRAAVALRRAIGQIPSDDAMAAVEERDAVVRMLSSLTPRQRAVVVLRDVLGLTSADTAEALGIRPSTVRVLGARARALLKKELGGEDEQAG